MERGTMPELANQIMQLRRTKRDFLAPTRAIAVMPDRDEITLCGPDVRDNRVEGPFEMNGIFHDQIADHLHIRKDYYRDLGREHPDVRRILLNALLERAPEEEVRMVRTLEGKARALVSDRYNRLDHEDVLQAVAPVFQNLQVQGRVASITDSYMYLEVTTPKLEGEVRRGDVIQAGIALSNSEVGYGAVNVESMLFRLACLNGAIQRQMLRRTHLGSRMVSEGAHGQPIQLSAETRAVDNLAFWGTVRDVVRFALTEKVFGEMLRNAQRAANLEIPPEVNKPKLVQMIADDNGFSQDETDTFLSRLMESKDMTAWDMANALTAVAHNLEDTDRAVAMQRIGGEVIEMEPIEWDRAMQRAVSYKPKRRRE